MGLSAERETDQKKHLISEENIESGTAFSSMNNKLLNRLELRYDNHQRDKRLITLFKISKAFESSNRNLSFTKHSCFEQRISAEEGFTTFLV